MEEPIREPRRADRGSLIIAAALVASATILSFGSSDGPRYQLVASGDAIVRMDNDSGAMIACNLERCTEIQPPDRAGALRPLRNLVGGPEDKGGNQISGPPAER